MLFHTYLDLLPINLVYFVLENNISLAVGIMYTVFGNFKKMSRDIFSSVNPLDVKKKQFVLSLFFFVFMD